MHWVGEDDVIVDVPGFKDTDGVVLEIVNQFCLIKVLTNSDSFKIVFVASQDSFGDKLKASIENFVDMFSDVKFMRKSLGFAITKLDCHKK